MISVLYNTKGKLWVIKTYCCMQGKLNKILETWHKLHENPIEAWDFPIFEPTLPSCSALHLFLPFHSLSVQPSKPLRAAKQASPSSTHAHPLFCPGSDTAFWQLPIHRPKGTRLSSQRWNLFWSPVSYSCPIMVLPRDSTIWSIMKCHVCWRSQKLWVTGTDLEKFYF